MSENSTRTIVGVIKDSNDEIEAYKLDSGEIVQKEEAISLAKEGRISGVQVSTSRKGEKYLRSNPDGTKNNNLDNLPEIE
ncbi:hypothetical protein CSC2_20880 [Clostridium zeae]|uniref:DUF3892 domain-containing protein n=1 Tax=Clostridium zeae TaxID=2759022 RepID=A0ABQ1E9U2_9CLOT|nr:DUF3892 domain-containing protein [Clostridium zeae]GFZ31562.1 hypothetical protein CSC2_20880 [Clostridium zeae]